MFKKIYSQANVDNTWVAGQITHRVVQSMEGGTSTPMLSLSDVMTRQLKTDTQSSEWSITQNATLLLMQSRRIRSMVALPIVREVLEGSGH